MTSAHNGRFYFLSRIAKIYQLLKINRKVLIFSVKSFAIVHSIAANKAKRQDTTERTGRKLKTEPVQTLPSANKVRPAAKYQGCKSLNFCDILSHMLNKRKALNRKQDGTD